MQKKVSIKSLYLLLVISLGLIGLGIGSTYAMFVSKTEIENPITFASNLSYTSDVLDTVTVLVPSKGVETVTLNVTNSSGSSVNYVSWYVDDGYDITVNSIGGQNTGTTASGVLTDGGTATITVEVVNKESRSITVLLGVTSGSDSVVLGSNMVPINEQNVLMTVSTGTSTAATDVFLRYDDDGTTGLLRNQISSVTFVDNISASTGTGMTSIDVSMHQDGSVIMWYGAANSSSLYDVYIGGKNGKVAIKDMSYLFMQMTNLVSVDFANAVNSEANTLMTWSFDSDQKLQAIDFSGFSTMNVTMMNTTFGDCMKLTDILYIETFDTSKVISMATMFTSCSVLSNLDVSNWSTPSLVNTRGMFQGCSELTALDLSNWDTSNVTDMKYMFNQCYSLAYLNLINFDTSSVTDMEYMFWGCSSLTTLDVSNFNTANVTNMFGMFSGCSGLTMLDLSRFNTSQVTNMAAMFQNCSNLTTIYVSNLWNTSSVTNSSFMFIDCTSLVGGSGTTYNSSYVNMTYARIDGGTSSPGYFTDIATI